MANKLTYLDFAENDYKSLMKIYDCGITGNLVCSNAQKTCERYLKHLLDIYVQDVSEQIMRSHSLKALKNEVKRQLPDFSCDWAEVSKADGFYFTATYPGDDSFFAEEDETKECMDALKYTRTAVLAYIKQKEEACVNKTDDLLDERCVKDAISFFDDYDDLN